VRRPDAHAMSENVGRAGDEEINRQVMMSIDRHVTAGLRIYVSSRNSEERRAVGRTTAARTRSGKQQLQRAVILSHFPCISLPHPVSVTGFLCLRRDSDFGISSLA